MADSSRKISIRLSLEDAEKVKAQLAALGSEGEKALRQIENAGKQPGPGLKALNELTEEGKHHLESLKDEAGVLGRALSQFGVAGGAAAIGLGALVAVITESTKAAAEAEAIHKRLDNVLLATGNTTGLARHEFDALAESLSKAFAIDDDKIRQVATSLASFSSVSGPAFKGAIEQAAHLSAVFGGDLSENVEKIGVVMERLAGGSVDGLNKAFKFLSEAEKDQLRTMAESGRGFEAQMVLVDDLKHHLGDAGTEDSLNKATDRLHVAWEDLLKSIGDTRPWHDLISLMADAVNGLSKLIGKSQELNSIGAVDDKIAALAAKRATIVSEKSRIEGQLTGNDFSDSPLAKFSVASAQKRIDQIDKETESLQKQRVEMHSAEVQAKAHAAAQQYDTLAAQDAAAEAKDLAEQTKGAADARKKAVDAINKQVEALKDERAQLNLSERERKIHIELIKAEQTAREAGFKLSGQTKADIIKAAGDAFDSEEVRTLAEKQAKQISENIKHATNEVVNFGRDAFEKILEGGNSSFKSLSESLVSFMRKAFAQIASEAVIRPLIQPIVSDFLGGGSGGIAGSITGAASGSRPSSSGVSDIFGFGKSAFDAFGSTSYFAGGPIGGSFSGFLDGVGTSLGFAPAAPSAAFVGPMPAGSLFGGTTFGGFLGGAGLGFGAGSLLNGLVGGNSTGGTIGSAGGALAGAAIGSIVPGIGTVLGGLLGGAGGGLLGGLFGDDSGYQEAVKQRERTKEMDAVSREITQLLAATKETTQFAQALQQIQNQFDAAKAKAEQYGLSIDGINKVEQQQIDKLRQGFKDTIENQIAALENNPSSALAALKKAQDQRYSEAIDAEADLSRVRKLNQLETEAFYKNLTAEQITAMGEMARAIDRINAQLKDLGGQLGSMLQDQLSLVQSGINDAKAQADAYRSLAVTLRDQIFSLRTGNLTTLSPSQSLDEMRGRFGTLLSSAKDGNQSALRALPQLANSLLDASNKFYGSTEAYAQDFNAVTDALQQAGVRSDQFGGAQDYRTTLLESQLNLLKDIRDNLAKASPDAPLLKQQLSALGVVGDLVSQTNSLSANQADLLSSSNATQDILAKLTAQNTNTAASIVAAITGGNAQQLTVGESISIGMLQVRDTLGKYINVLEQRYAQEQADKLKAVADAAKQAKIDASLADVRQKAVAVQNKIAATPAGDFTENMHEWVVQFNTKTGAKTYDGSGDKGGQYEQQRAEMVYQAATSASQQLIKALGFTSSLPDVFLSIATKYGSSVDVGGTGMHKYGINDYQGIIADILNRTVQLGAGGNKQLVDYAKTLNWLDIAGSMTAIEKKAIDLGLRGFASGTLSAPAGMAWVGEQGPELVRFRGGEQVIPAPASASMHQADVVKALQMHAAATVSKLDQLGREMTALRREFMLQRQENRAA